MKHDLSNTIRGQLPILPYHIEPKIEFRCIVERRHDVFTTPDVTRKEVPTQKHTGGRIGGELLPVLTSGPWWYEVNKRSKRNIFFLSHETTRVAAMPRAIPVDYSDVVRMTEELTR